MSYYPISLELENLPCVVIGGGKVAERKVMGLLECGARVTVISPDITPEISSLHDDGSLVWLNREYERGDLEGAFLVIAATDNVDVQLQAHEEAGRLGSLLNVADVPKWCNFILPATVRQGDLTVSISTGGKSPAFARQLRMELEKRFGPEYKIMLSILGALRPYVLAEGRPQSENEVLFNQLLHPEIPEWIRNRAWDKLESHLLSVLGDIMSSEVLGEVRGIVNLKQSAAG